MPIAETARVVATLELEDKLSKGVNTALRSVGKLEKRLGKIGGIAARGASQAGQNLERGIVVGAVAAGGALAFATNAAIEWESSVAGVNKTLSGTPEELKAVTDGLRAMATDLPVAATDLASIAEAGGQMGIASKDILAFTKQVAILGTTTNVSFDDAATALGQLQNVIGLTGDEFDNFAATLVDLGNKGSSTEADILEITRRAGSSAKTIGIAKDATLAWSAAVANLGVAPELGGTSLQAFFLKSQRLITSGGKGLARFAKVAGVSAKDFKRAYEKDASGALQKFIAGLSKLNAGDRTKVIDQLFGKGSGLTRVIGGLANSYTQNLVPAINDSETAWKDATAAQAEADKRFATTASQLQLLKNNVNDAAVSIGTELLPILNDLAKEGVSWIKENQSTIKNFGKDLAVNIREAVRWAKSLDWNAIGNALKAGAGFAKGLVDAFLSAPPWLQAFLAGGFVANKFTGGALTAIGGEIAKGIAGSISGQFFARGSSPANPVFVSGTGIGGPAAGVPGAAAKGLSGLQKMFLVGEAIGLVVAVNDVRTAIENDTTQQAKDISTQTDKYLAAQPSKDALKVALAGIDEGIKKLEADPIGTALIAGPALESLKQDRAKIVAALEKFGAGHAREGSFADPIVSAIDSEKAAISIAIRDGLKNLHTATKQQIEQFHRVEARLAKEKTDPFRFIEREARQGDAKGGILPAIQTLVRSFQAGNSPWARDLGKMKNHLQNLKDAERAFRAKGDVKTANAIKGQVKILQGVINGKLAATNSKLDAIASNTAKQGPRIPGSADTGSESSGTRFNADPTVTKLDTSDVVTAVNDQGSKTRTAVTAAGAAAALATNTQGAQTRTTITTSASTAAAATAALQATAAAEATRSEAAMVRIQAATAAVRSTVASGDTRSEAALSRLQGATGAVRSAVDRTKGAVNGVATAVRNKKLSVSQSTSITIPVTTNVSARGIVRTNAHIARFNNRSII